MINKKYENTHHLNSNNINQLNKKPNYISIKYLASYLIGDSNYTKIFVKILIFLIVIGLPIYYYQLNKEQIKTSIDKYTKGLIISKVVRSKTIIDKISWEILVLVKQEKIKKLMRELIINDVLPNKEIRADLYRIVKRETIAYLKSEDCRRELKALLINEVLRNEDIRSDLYSLIKQLITLKEINFLEDKLEKILVDVLNIEAVHTHVAKKIEEEVQKTLRQENMIQMAVNILSEKFK